jgi:hypothetical protein
VAERFDLLEDSILGNPKILLAKSRDRKVVAVLHARMQNHQLNIDLNGVLILALIILAMRRLPEVGGPGKKWNNQQEKKQDPAGAV